VAGSFDRRFLDLPREVSVTVMREHQKYFAVEDSEGQLSGHFLGVMNTRSDAEGHIRKGHERVLKARLSDALFFWDVDGKRTLAERVEDLASVTFHKKLGSYKDKIDRMQVLARTVNDQTGAGVPADVLEQVIGWSKSDLVTDLVGEFADLQGVIGGLYARREGASDEVWKAIYDQYRPAGLDDRSPETLSGVVLALTDRIDTLFGCFSVGLIPKGSADPLALRRQTQGVIKTLLDHHLPFSIEAVITADGRMNAETASAFRSFYTDRLKYILGRMGFAYDEINAVVATGVDNPSDVRARVEALHTVRQSPDLEPIAAAFKRIKNILRQAEIPGSLPAPTGSMEPEEEALASAVGSLGPRIDTYMSSGDYDRALGEMATLRPVVDGFFLKILVMHEDDAIRSRRLNLLKSLSESFLKVADVSEIVTSTDTATAAGDS
jgi:glycyl-tRNA synthetase beta chain